MTENKRFAFDSEVGFIDLEKCGGDTTSNNEVVDSLNELNDKNKELKGENKRLNNDIVCLGDSNSNLCYLLKEADDLIQSHMNPIFIREWENMCRNREVDLNG